MDLDILFSATTNESKVVKKAARNSGHYQRMKTNHPEKIKKQRDAGNLATKIKRLEDEKLRDVCNQKGRIECADIRTASKKLAVDSGTFNKHLSQDGLALIKRKYFAWRKTHPSMQSFYVKLCAENHECLIGYDAKRLSRIVETHKFSLLKEDDDSDQEGEDEEMGQISRKRFMITSRQKPRVQKRIGMLLKLLRKEMEQISK